MWLLNTFLQLAIGLLIAYRAIAKDNQIPIRANCMRNLRNAWNADKVSNIALGELNLKFKKWRNSGNIFSNFRYSIFAVYRIYL